MAAYLDGRRRPYIHLVDGGLADNLGLRGPLDLVVPRGDTTRALQEKADAVSRYTFETLELLHAPLSGWVEDGQATLCANSGTPSPTGAGNTVCKEIDFYLVEVGFAAAGGGATRP